MIKWLNVLIREVSLFHVVPGEAPLYFQKGSLQIFPSFNNIFYTCVITESALLQHTVIEEYIGFIPWNFPLVCSVFPNFSEAEQ